MRKIKLIIYDDGTTEEFGSSKPANAKPANGAYRSQASPDPDFPAAVQKIMSDGKGYKPAQLKKKLAQKWYKGRHVSFVASSLSHWVKDNNRFGIIKDGGLYYYVEE